MEFNFKGGTKWELMDGETSESERIVYTFPTSTMVKWKWTQRLCWCCYRMGTMVLKVAIVEMTIFYSDIVYRHITSSDIVRVGHL